MVDVKPSNLFTSKYKVCVTQTGPGWRTKSAGKSTNRGLKSEKINEKHRNGTFNRTNCCHVFCL